MKAVSIFVLALLGNLTYSQTDILVNNTWYLVGFDNECFGITPGENEEFNINEIILDFYEQDGELRFHSEMCTTMDGVVSILTDTTIGFDNLTIGQDTCENPINEQYEQGFACALGAEYGYTITENSDGSMTLAMENDIFMSATFRSQQLSIQEGLLRKTSIFPNPVNDKLIIYNPETDITKVKITDTKGRIVFDQNTNASKIEIDFKGFEKGIYFVTLESNGKTIQTEKVIKK